MVRKNGSATFPAAHKTETPFCFCQSGFQIGFKSIVAGTNERKDSIRLSLFAPTIACNVWTPAFSSDSAMYEISGRPRIGTSGLGNNSPDARKREPVPAMSTTASVISRIRFRNTSADPKVVCVVAKGEKSKAPRQTGKNPRRLRAAADLPGRLFSEYAARRVPVAALLPYCDQRFATPRLRADCPSTFAWRRH